MPSQRVFAFGEPENDGERRVIRYLDENLPPGYRIYHNLERQSGGQTYEYDVLVLAPHAFFAIEVKDWPGRIVGNDREWLLNNGAVRKNPCRLVEKKARILKSVLVEGQPFLNAVWTEPLVVIADDLTRLDLAGACAGRTVLLPDAVARITDIGNSQWAGRDHRARFQIIENALTQHFRSARSEREVAHFRLLEQLDATALYTEWRAENRFSAITVPARLKIYALDPYQPQAQQQAQLQLVSRDFTAASRLGNHPNIRGARDFFPEESGRYVLVLDDIPGCSLSAAMLEDRTFTFEHRLRLVADIAAGLAHAHAFGVIHRDVRPENIWLAPAGAVLTNFDCARVSNGSTIHSLLDEDLNPVYRAPEMRASAAAATEASDIYSLGVVLYQLLTGRLPTDKPVAASAFDALVDRGMDQLVLGMLEVEPARRPTADEVAASLAGLQEQRNAATSAPAHVPADEEGEIRFSVGELIEEKYQVLERLGEGSFGCVYRVYSAIADRDYAMKVFHNRGLGLEEVQAEFKALVELTHPRIVRVYHPDMLRRQKTYYLLTDHIEGEPLQNLLGTSRKGPRELLRLVRQLLEALEYLHRHGYVHRDIKPSNILVSSSGAHLVDFGIAVRASGDAIDGPGTPLYKPPDIAHCAGDPSRDLFAAGVVLYELLTGRHPYEGAPDAGAHPREPLEHAPQLSDSLAALLRRAVAPLAAQRFASAAEFIEALDAIGEPLRPPPPQLHMVEGIHLTIEERNRPNYNPYLTRFLTLYSQNRRDNSGTRGYDEVSRATYVQTRLDQYLAPDVLRGKYRLVIITGNAGDGKTAFLQSLEEKVARGDETRAPISVTRLPSGNGSTFGVDGRTYQTNYDGSQDEAGVQNDDVLAEFFGAFRGTVSEANAGTTRDCHLIAINEGKLRDFLARRQGEFPWLAAALSAYLDQEAPLPPDVVLVNLNDRSVVAGDQSILDRQIRTLCAPSFWEPCRNCCYVDRCPVKFNVDTITNPELGPRVRERLERLFEIAHLRGRVHLTMRSVRSALAYILLGENDCAAIGAVLDDAIGRSEEISRSFYYNALAASANGVPDDRETLDPTGDEVDRLLRLLSEPDVGLCANPADDRDLHFNGLRSSRLLPRVSGRSEYDREILASEAERLAGSDQRDEVADQRHHASLRRKAFFERPDAGWEQMLPYEHLQEMQRACAGDTVAIQALKAMIVSGINHGEGLADMADCVILRLARGVPGRVRSFRQFPVADFLLTPVQPPIQAEYVENSPHSLLFTYRTDTNGKGRIRVRIGLDLLELLGRMAEGYAPTAAESRGALVNLLVFRTLLAQQSYNRVVLVDAAEDRRFEVHQEGWRLRLTAKEMPNAAGKA